MIKNSQPKFQDSHELRQSITAVQEQCKGLRKTIRLVFILWLATIMTGAVLFWIRNTNEQKHQERKILYVRGLVVVDETGTPRIQIGAPLPDPPILGKRVARGSTAHGILLFDAEGNERSGYVTMDESGQVMLTLDEIGRMVARFYAYPAGGAHLMMSDQYQNQVDLGLFQKGPYLKLKHGGNESVLQPQDGSEK